jgi:hypothetical protein
MLFLSERIGMSRIINGFKDPVKRPRFIIWTVTILLFLVAFVIVALGVTSTYWFCSSVCHSVQDDSINQYNRSTHAKVSCMVCHMPVGADPVTYVLHKAEALGELYLTATGKYELPLNKGSHLAMAGFTTTHCTQCHALENRKVTPSAGIIINHEVHTNAGIRCTWCHNRIAHNVDGYTPILKDPQTGELSTNNPNFISMDGCFRCHSLEDGAKIPGNCDACHTPEFDLKPADHKTEGFMKEHGKAALEQEKKVEEAKAENAKAGEGGHGVSDPTDTYPLPKDISEVNSCYTCHAQKFCDDCHGVTMPHPADFRKTHGTGENINVNTCTTCHSKNACESCHHGEAIGWKDYKPAASFISQHVEATRAVGATACFECHDPTFCSACHVNGGKRPAGARSY